MNTLLIASCRFEKNYSIIRASLFYTQIWSDHPDGVDRVRERDGGSVLSIQNGGFVWDLSVSHLPLEGAIVVGYSY